MMKAELTVCDEVVALVVSGELDAYTSPEVRDRLAEALEQDARWVLVDLTQTEFIDSFFLGILMGAGKRAGEKDGDITVVCHRDHLLITFHRSGTTELLNVVPTREQAEELIVGWKSASEDVGARCQEEENS